MWRVLEVPFQDGLDGAATVSEASAQAAGDCRCSGMLAVDDDAQVHFRILPGAVSESSPTRL